MHVFKMHSRPNESETPEVQPSTVFTGPPGNADAGFSNWTTTGLGS